MAKFPRLCKSLEHLVDRWGPVEGHTRLVKLIYLADIEWAKRHGGTPYTEAKYYRWNHGVYSREVLQALEWMDGIEVVATAGVGGDKEASSYRAGANTRLGGIDLEPAFLDALDGVGDRWQKRSFKDLLEHVYGAEQFRDKAFGQPLL